MRNNRLMMIIGVVIILAVVLAGAAFFLSQQNPTPEQSIPATAQQSETTADSGLSGAGLTVYVIDPAQSVARFKVDEVLRGDPVTVVGETSDLSGQIKANLSDLSNAQVGPITIAAGTFITPESKRNQAIKRFILNTNQFANITFSPTDVSGLPASVAPGETVSFQLSGDLTIRDVTQPVTFEVSGQAVSERELQGQARAAISREAYNLTIPSVPFVADVGDEVTLELEFVAVSQ